MGVSWKALLVGALGVVLAAACAGAPDDVAATATPQVPLRVLALSASPTAAATVTRPPTRTAAPPIAPSRTPRPSPTTSPTPRATVTPAASATATATEWVAVTAPASVTPAAPTVAPVLSATPGALSATPTLAAVATQPPPTNTPAASATTGAPPGDPLPPAPIAVSALMRTIYAQGLAAGNNPAMFARIGDCQAVVPFFLAMFDTGDYRLGPAYAYLQPVIDHFRGSFNRNGLLAHEGLNTTSVLDTAWAPPALCSANETPLACEVRLSRPSFAIISLGTNGAWQPDDEYTLNMRLILDYLLQHGVVPILSTKADNVEGGDRFNTIVRALAVEYQAPLWDFAAVARALPEGGLADAYHLTWGRADYDTAPQPYTGWQARNLTALQALDAVWRGVQ